MAEYVRDALLAEIRRALAVVIPEQSAVMFAEIERWIPPDGALPHGPVTRRAVELLALTHISTRSHPREIRHEAAAEFPRVVVPRDFDQVEIPFRERGAPIVRSLRDRPKPAAEVGAATEAGAPKDRATVSTDDL